MWSGSKGFKHASLAVVVSVLGAFAAAGALPAGAASGTAAKCSGDPIVFGVISAITAGPATQEIFPDAPGPVIAAAKAVTKACTAGVPVEVSVCDSQSEPNTAAACARQGVEEGWVAWFNGDTLTGGQTFPILAEAGIPELGGLGLGPEVASKLWFPIGGAIASILTTATLAESATVDEPAKLAVVTLDNPQVDFLLGLLEEQMTALGGEVVATIAVPTSATDMAPYAAQVIDSGANALMPVLAPEQANGLFQQLIQQGTNFVDLALIFANGTNPTASKDLHDQFGSEVKGIWIVNQTALDDPKNPGVRQYVKELKAAKHPTKGRWVLGDPALGQWALLHISAELLADAPVKDAAALIDALNTAGPISKPGLPTVDYAAHPFADNPTLASLRVFTNEFIATRFKSDASEVIVSDGFVTVGEPFKPKKLK